MRRLIAIALAFLLALQGAWAADAGPLQRCACGGMASLPAAPDAGPAPADGPAGDTPCHVLDDGSPAAGTPLNDARDDARGDATDGSHDDTRQAAADVRDCCDGACAACDAPLHPALPGTARAVAAAPVPQPCATFVPAATTDHVPAVPLRPPCAARA